jgi:SNF2 family DNA or RNA helicase
VVCPASLVPAWEHEAHKFTPDLRVKAVYGTVAQRHALLESDEPTDLLITSYDLLKRDAPFYAHSEFLWQVLDEAQFIKNPKTAAAKSVKIIKAAHRLALTGTPIENRLSELWSIFDYLMPGFLYRYETFKRKFETPIVREGNAAVSEQLRKMAGPFILRRLKQDVLKDLPEKLEEVRYSAFEEEQQRLYDARVTYLKGLLEDFGSNRMTILAELTRLRQVCCDPSLLVEGYTGGSAKREACLDLIESALDGGHRVLVFSQFTSMLALLEDDLTEREIPYFLLTGATPKEERVRLMHAFNEGTTPVFLISLKAGGTGLNLTGADIVIHYDPWWNLAAQNQATDRAHRIGQTKVVSVYRLIAKHTIEEKILALQEEKKDLADAILAGEQSSLMSLSYEELCSLLDA